MEIPMNVFSANHAVLQGNHERVLVLKLLNQLKVKISGL